MDFLQSAIDYNNVVFDDVVDSGDDDEKDDDDEDQIKKNSYVQTNFPEKNRYIFRPLSF